MPHNVAAVECVSLQPGWGVGGAVIAGNKRIRTIAQEEEAPTARSDPGMKPAAD